MDYESLRLALRSRIDLEAGNPASEDQIETLAGQMGPLPEDYRMFLRDFGWVSFGPYEIFGFGPAVPKYLDVLHMTELERDEAGLPSNLVVIMNDGGGNLTCIARREHSPEFEIVLWDHETSLQTGSSRAALTFSSFLGRMLSE